MNKHRAKNSDSMMESSTNGKLLLSFLTLLPFIMLVISVSTLFDLRWYWSLIISFVGTILLWDVLSWLYSSVFGVKTKPTLSLLELKYVRYNLHIIDALITCALGVILYLIAL